MSAPESVEARSRRIPPFRAMSFARKPLLAALAVVGSLALLVASSPSPAIADGVRPSYRPPVEAPVVDPFRPPPDRWSAGNRGIEYGTVPGTLVGAIGPGAVVFAGPVAGSRHVTIRHPDGLRSSYSHLATIRVSVGDRVTTGSPVGVAGPTVHVGVRRGDTYLDPASLWGRAVGGGAARLVPDLRASPRRPDLSTTRDARRGTTPTGTALTWAALRLGRVAGASLHSFVGPPLGVP